MARGRKKRVRILKGKQTVASSRNLECILRYQRQHASIKSVTQRGNYLFVKYEDGARCKVRFESKTVLREWIRKKRARGVFPPHGGW